MRLHLDFRSSNDKDKAKRTYYLACCYRNDEGKPRKKRIEKIGRLSNVDYKNWQLRLEYFNAEDLSDVCKFSKLKIFSSKRYLDVAVLSAIYDKLGISDSFKYISPLKDVDTASVAKILILARCLDPQSNSKTVDWFRESVLPDILNIPFDKYNKDKIFRELPLIHKRKKHLQTLFYSWSEKLNKDGVKLYFFDGTTSFFEGSKCPIACPGKDKTTGYQDKMILICLMTDKIGFPIAWDVVEGNKKDMSEFKKIALDMTAGQDISDVTFCFDRGIASSNNFNLIENILESKYITGLDDNQISGVFNLESFVKNTRSLLIKDFESQNEKQKGRYPINGFYRLGDNRYYKDLGVDKNNKNIRHILSFNMEIYLSEKRLRERLIEQIKERVIEINSELQSAKGDRNDEVLAKTLDQLITKYRLQKIINYKIIPHVVVSGKNKKKAFQSYRVDISIDLNVKEDAEKQDGILVYITNHIESTNGFFDVSARTIVGHYKDKFIIENAFRHIKSFTDLRPFYVWLEDHVKAHVDVCMSSYFIDHYIGQQLKEMEVGLHEFYYLLEKYTRVSSVGTNEENCKYILNQLPNKLIDILKKLEVEHVIDPSYMRRYAIQY